MSEANFEIGDLVWVKKENHSLWPAKISQPPKEEKSKTMCYVCFLGTQTYAWVPNEKVQHHAEHLIPPNYEKISPFLKLAIDEIILLSKDKPFKEASKASPEVQNLEEKESVEDKQLMEEKQPPIKGRHFYKVKPTTVKEKHSNKDKTTTLKEKQPPVKEPVEEKQPTVKEPVEEKQPPVKENQPSLKEPVKGKQPPVEEKQPSLKEPVMEKQPCVKEKQPLKEPVKEKLLPVNEKHPSSKELVKERQPPVKEKQPSSKEPLKEKQPPVEEMQPSSKEPIKEKKPVEEKQPSSKAPVKEKQPPVEEKQPSSGELVKEKQPFVEEKQRSSKELVKEKQPPVEEKQRSSKEPVKGKQSPVKEKQSSLKEPVKEKHPSSKEPLKEKQPPVEEKQPSSGEPVKGKQLPVKEKQSLKDPVKEKQPSWKEPVMEKQPCVKEKQPSSKEPLKEKQPPVEETQPSSKEPIKEKKPVEEKQPSSKEPVKEKQPPVKEKQPSSGERVKEKQPRVEEKQPSWEPVKEKQPPVEKKQPSSKDPVKEKQPPVEEKQPSSVETVKEKQPPLEEKQPSSWEPVKEKEPPVEEKQPSSKEPVKEKQPLVEEKQSSLKKQVKNIQPPVEEKNQPIKKQRIEKKQPPTKEIKTSVKRNPVREKRSPIKGKQLEKIASREKVSKEAEKAGDNVKSPRVVGRKRALSEGSVIGETSLSGSVPCRKIRKLDEDDSLRSSRNGLSADLSNPEDLKSDDDVLSVNSLSSNHSDLNLEFLFHECSTKDDDRSASSSSSHHSRQCEIVRRRKGEPKFQKPDSPTMSYELTSSKDEIFIPHREPSPVDNQYEKRLKMKHLAPTTKVIGFLGLGTMGQRIVKNLLISKHKVIVWNRTKDKCKVFVESGATQAENPAEVVKASDIIFNCVSDVIAVKSILFCPEGVLKGIEDSCTHENIFKGYVEMSSIGYESSMENASDIIGKGCRYLEASMTGTRTDANLGALSILASGDFYLYRECLSCFHAFAANAYFVGAEVGVSSKLSIPLSMCISTAYAGLAEVIALANRLKVKMVDVLALIKMRHDVPKSFVEKGKNMIRGKYFDTEFSLINQQKDIDLSLELSNEYNRPLYMAAAANEAYKHAKMLGYGDHDVSAVFQGVKS